MDGFGFRPRMDYYERPPEWRHHEPMGPWRPPPPPRAPFHYMPYPSPRPPPGRFHGPPMPPAHGPDFNGYYDSPGYIDFDRPPVPPGLYMTPRPPHRSEYGFTRYRTPLPLKKAKEDVRSKRKLSEFAEIDYEKLENYINFDDMPETDKEAKDVSDDFRIEIKKSKTKERILLQLQTEDPDQCLSKEHPVSLIHELHPDLKWDFVGTAMSGKVITSFNMKLILNDEQSYEAEGPTKKLAKLAAAKLALSSLYGIVFPENQSLLEDGKGDRLSKVSARNIFDGLQVLRVEEKEIISETLATRIGEAIIERGKAMLCVFDETNKWNVLAGIVLTKSNDSEYLKVICCTSGTKCVKGDSLSMVGAVLHDCHAEVLARRCFVHYLYTQIFDLTDSGYQDKEDFIIERREDQHGFRLKKDLQVHLFISSAPCGDARVFSPKDENQGTGDPHPNRMSRGLLRAKIEAGEGTIPVKTESCILTWDGIAQGGQRLQFMSCSDKIAMWNIAGLQGALLSHFIEPIYLESVVLASLFNFEHLTRAVHGRFNLNYDSKSLTGLPKMYRLNKLRVGKAILPAADTQRQLTKTPGYALNWLLGDDRAEVLSCETGKLHKEGTVSRLSKRSFFEQFRRLLGRNAPTLPSCQLGSTIPLVYRDGKTASMEYLRAKLQAVQSFQEQNLGTWIQVPSEVDIFGL
ncbi:Double-stranded RNA-specific editase 1 [Halotydeus destructor]|nr:Double-stranded RNA-specific editase 1 [Halotydeus destructor]